MVGIMGRPINLRKRMAMGARPAVGAGMIGPAQGTAPGAMPMMKKGGKVKKKCHGGKMAKGGHVKHKAKGGHMKVDFAGHSIHTTPESSHKDHFDHIPGEGKSHFKHGGAVSKHKGTKHGHHRMRSSGVHKMHHGHKD